jgi:hypothetical protein
VELPIPSTFLAILTGGVTLVILGMILLSEEPARAQYDRVLDHAWNLLVPRLLASGLSSQQQALVNALALFSVGKGDPASRERVLEKARRALEEAVVAGRAPEAYLAALWRLTIEDTDPAMQDPVSLCADQAARYFDGGMSVSFAKTLLSSLDGDAWKGPALFRLKALLCGRAFDAGLELQDLRQLAGADPALRRVLQPEKLEYLAHLKLIHDVKATKSFEGLGKAIPIFQIARVGSAVEPLLGKIPDLLLTVDLDPPLYFGVRGLVFLDTWFYDPLRNIEVIASPHLEEGGFHLVLNSTRFWFGKDPTPTAHKLAKWFHYYFKEFCPQVGAVYQKQGSPAMRRVVSRNGARCPECRRRLLPVAGDVGITDDAPRRDEIPMVLPVGNDLRVVP